MKSKITKLITSYGPLRYLNNDILCLNVQVGDQVVEINGEQTQGISHTRAIELIQAGGSKVLLLLRPQALLSENSEL